MLLCSSADADGPAPLELPNQWLWDIIDEFIYQVYGYKTGTFWGGLASVSTINFPSPPSVIFITRVLLQVRKLQ